MTTPLRVYSQEVEGVYFFGHSFRVREYTELKGSIFLVIHLGLENIL